MFFNFLFISCQGDIGLIYTDKNSSDTSDAVVNAIEETGSFEDTYVESNDDTSTQPEAYGVSGYFSMELQQIACPYCFGVSREINTTFQGFFHETISDSHFNESLHPGECSTSDYIYRPSYNLINHSSQIGLYGNNYSFEFYNNQMQFYSNQIFESQFERDTIYTVTTDHGSFNYQSIHGFDFIEPFEMLYVDPSYAFSAHISSYGQTFYWGPSGSNSLFEISLEIFSYDGSQFLGLVTCSGQDSGSLTIPSNYISQYPQGSLVAIILTRHKRSQSIYNPLNSYIETHMKWQVVGTGYIY